MKTICFTQRRKGCKEGQKAIFTQRRKERKEGLNIKGFPWPQANEPFQFMDFTKSEIETAFLTPFLASLAALREDMPLGFPWPSADATRILFWNPSDSEKEITVDQCSSV